MIDALAASPLVHALGLALLEFLWQGAAIAAVGATLLFGLRRASADSRYLVACAALACMAVAPVVSVVIRVSDPAFTERIRRAGVVDASAGSGAPRDPMNDARASVTAAAIDPNEAGAANGAHAPSTVGCHSSCCSGASA